ncbi:unnamed protein product [Owenia fusiformis]|uniref:Uncharacterized protein n=1 Tax=Owenia fusiformis TaxID=6347 RepID=A0A8J1U9E8_OWEFU|nr:unnamed protein product [Owenia fusiformis]
MKTGTRYCLFVGGMIISVLICGINLMKKWNMDDDTEQGETLPAIPNATERRDIVSVSIKRRQENELDEISKNAGGRKSWIVTSTVFNKTYIKETTRPSALGEVIEHAKMVAKEARGGIVAVTMVNEAYLELTYSWLCNTANMSVHDNVLIIATDETTLQRLQKDWPRINTVLYSINNSELSYNEVGYVRYMLIRTRFLVALLISKIQVLLFEVDAIWFSSPLPLLQTLVHYDLVAAQISTRNHTIAGGFLFLQPSAIQVLNRVVYRLQKFMKIFSNIGVNKQLPVVVNDQTILQEVVVSQPNLKYKLLDFDIIADGQWYTRTNALNATPIVLNNNWIIGNRAKIARAKKFGHWFQDESGSCDWIRVRKITKIV